MDKSSQCHVINNDYIAYIDALDNIFNISNIINMYNLSTISYDKNIHLSSYISSIESQIQKIKYYMVLDYLHTNTTENTTNIEIIKKRNNRI